MKPRDWKNMSIKDKGQKLACKCKHNGIQDALHMVYECTATKDIIDIALDKIKHSLNKTDCIQNRKYQKMQRSNKITYSLTGLRKIGSKKKPTRRQERDVVHAWSKTYTEINTILTTF